MKSDKKNILFADMRHEELHETIESAIIDILKTNKIEYVCAMKILSNLAHMFRSAQKIDKAIERTKAFNSKKSNIIFSGIIFYA